MKIIAVICARNEVPYLREVIPYLGSEKIDVVLIDHGSTDGLQELVSDGRYANVVKVEALPYNGVFDLTEQLRAKAAAIETVDADWIIHQDADEILQSPTHWGGLRQHIEIADSKGFNTLNFNELTMLPADPDVDDFIRNNRNYYFYEPQPLRLMRAWKKSAQLENVNSGGHLLRGADVCVYPQRMILKHFIVRSQRHAFEKYMGRTFAPSDLAKGWHVKRVSLNERNLTIPTSAPALQRLSDPKETPVKFPASIKSHFWEWS